MILDLISFLAIFVNAGLIASTTKTFEGESIVTAFILLLLLFLSLKYFTRMAIPDVPAGVIITSKRHNTVKENIKKGYKASSDSKLKKAPVKLTIVGLPVKMPEGTILNINRNDVSRVSNNFNTPKHERQGEVYESKAGNTNNRRNLDDTIPLMGPGDSNLRDPKEIVLEKNI